MKYNIKKEKKTKLQKKQKNTKQTQKRETNMWCISFFFDENLDVILKNDIMFMI